MGIHVKRMATRVPDDTADSIQTMSKPKGARYRRPRHGKVGTAKQQDAGHTLAVWQTRGKCETFITKRMGLGAEGAEV